MELSQNQHDVIVKTLHTAEECIKGLTVERDAALLQLSELKAKCVVGGMPIAGLVCVQEKSLARLMDVDADHDRSLGAEHRLSKKVEDTERLIGEYRRALEEIAHPPSRNGHWSEKVAEEALAEKRKEPS